MTSENKKFIMYLSGEDYYLYLYCLVIVLDHLKCRQGKVFKDYRKLPFIIEFVRNEKLNQIIINSPEQGFNRVDRELLFNSYSMGMSRRSEILKLLFTLEKKGIVEIFKAKFGDGVDVTLKPSELPKELLDKKLFKNEYENIKCFSKIVKRSSRLTLSTMLEKIYRQNGIATWQA